MTKQKIQEKVVSRKGLILLGIMGIVGLILLASGVVAIFEKSILFGVTSLVLGFFVYVIFILIERKLKLL
jgi:hypothetical protein